MNRRESATASIADQGLFRVAIVGAATLKGKELKDILQDRNFPALETKLLDDDEALGQIESVGEEATFVQSVRPENFEGLDFAFFAADEPFSRSHWKMAADKGCMIVDLSYALENEPGALVRAPWVERELEASLGVRPPTELDSTMVVVAHPAAVVLGLILLRAQKTGKIQSASCTIFEPASEHGRRGMDELHEQTVNLLSFQQMPRKVYDSQVAFNMVSRYGEKSQPTLESVERRIADHLRRTTYDRTIVPSMVLVQAPIFHAHAFSLYIEYDKRVSLGDLTQALSGEHVVISRVTDEAPSNVSAAGQDDILLSLRRDTHHENGVWLWLAADNLRVCGIEAVDCAAALARMRSKGPIQ